MPVIRAIVLDASGKGEDAARLLSDAQRQWPEDASVWAAEGMIQAQQKRFAEARKAAGRPLFRWVRACAEVKSALPRRSDDFKPSVDPGKLFLTRLPQDW